MNQYLPHKNFKICKSKEISLEQIVNTHDGSNIGCALLVDLKYPDNIEELSKKFPFCPENKKV